jgi:hypothetical protein
MKTEKIIELFTQNKSQALAGGFILILILCFVLGRYSVSIPSKDDLCDPEYKTITGLKEELSKKDAICEKRLRTQRDEDDVECKKRIRKAVDDNKDVSDVVTCEEVKVLIEPCRKRGLLR